jgi:cysteine synthase
MKKRFINGVFGKINMNRSQLYDSLSKRIGNTPLVRYDGEVSSGNEIWIKRECDGPFESHYDRVYLALFRHFEGSGKIQPGDDVFETTSGSAGVSFAGIGRELGYNCHVAIPAGGERAREDAITAQGAKIYLTPEEDYVSGFMDFILPFLKSHPGFFFMNHSMGRKGRNNEITLSALEGIVREVLDVFPIDVFIPGIGNGSSVLGPGRILQDSGRVVGFETFQSGAAFEQMYAGRYARLFGIKPGTLSRHQLPGTSFPGIDFPHIRNAVSDRVLDQVILVNGPRMEREYKKIGGRGDLSLLPRWDTPLVGLDDLGRSTRAGVVVALNLAKSERNKRFLVIGYDKADRYDE